MKSIFQFSILTLFCILSFNTIAQSLNLQGSWNVSLNEVPQVKMAKLPGTLDDAGLGTKDNTPIKVDISSFAHLSRKVYFVGKAKYSKSIFVPKSFQGKSITLELERVLWSSTIYVDDVQIPSFQNSLVSTHKHDLTDYIKPGKKQKLTIEIDNQNLIEGINVKSESYPSVESAEMAHAYTNHTQIKWNGVLGKVMLTSKPKISIENVKLTKNSDQISFNVKMNSYTENSPRFSIIYTSKGKRLKKEINASEISNLGDSYEFSVSGISSTEWSEFNPSVEKIAIVSDYSKQVDTFKTTIPNRTLSQENGDLKLNGQRIFLRGNLECVIFPKTGYPPTSVAEWKQLMQQAKNYGLNHLRFHSWCPPDAAFTAADEMGIYLQVELPNWNLKIGQDKNAWNFLKDEAFRIVNSYGNHPSFLLMSLGNELEGDFDLLNGLVKDLKNYDARRYYTSTSFTFQKAQTGDPQINDDFFVAQWTKSGWIRGQKVFNDDKADFTKDFSANSQIVKVPLISHEIGQYSVYPDFKEIVQYTGNLVPKNFMAIKADTEAKGLAKYNNDFVKSSGRLAAILYKEEIERAMKTKEFDGFQLLQLQDFPGQGTALVGLLNAFWKSKGVIEAPEFRQFCSEVVPLVRMSKPVFQSKENFLASIEIANFHKPLKNVNVVWNLTNDKGIIVHKGNIKADEIPVGNCNNIGSINVPLNEKSSTKYKLSVSIPGTKYTNNWNVWVQGEESLPNATSQHIYTDDIRQAIDLLQQGKKVFLTPRLDTLNALDNQFVPVFWSPVHFPKQPGTMGLLIKDKHPAFKGFPTSYHSDWQWRDYTVTSKVVDLGNIDNAAFLVRSIDNFVRNAHLSPLFEVKVGNGQLLFASFNWQGNKENSMLYKSLANYFQSAAFSPKVELSIDKLKSLAK